MANARALLAGTCAVYGRSSRAIGEADEIINAPWLAQIEYASGGTCAGSVVDATHILTAAHCFSPEDVENPTKNGVKVRVGATDKQSGGDVYEVKQIDNHPNAAFGDNEMYDLAVMTLANPIQFNEYVQPIEFVKKAVDGHVTVQGGGWGVTEADDFAPGLQTFFINMVPSDWCQKWLQTSKVRPENRGALMCFRAKSGTPCSGDSGSGLWLPAEEGQKAQLIGVLHGGVSCNMKPGTSFYVNILNENHRDFLSKFFDMSGVPVTPDTPIGENLSRMLLNEMGSPAGLSQGTRDMLDFLGVKA